MRNFFSRCRFTFSLFALFLIAGIGALASTADAGAVHHVKAEGIIDPVMSEYIIDAITGAEEARAEAVVIQLDTPGGLDLSMRDIVKKILASEVPVIVFVAPAGARAASAGVFIAYASHVAAMSLGTNIGSAHPVAMGGKEMDETMIKKVENDSVAYLKSIAEKRGRNIKWAEEAVRESVNITATEAKELKVIEFVADDVTSLLKAIDGHSVTLTSGERKLATAEAVIVTIEMGLRHRILSAITNPNVAYVLMMIGMVGLYFELSNPGAILPGVVGAISLVLAFYSFQTLPVNYAGLILIGLGILFFIAEIQVVSFGFLAIAGLISLTLGSLMLFDSPLPFMQVSFSVILPTIIIVSLFFIAMIYMAMNVYKQKPASGLAIMIGEEGIALSDFAAGDLQGRVFVDGEYWNAESTGPISEGEPIKILEIEGLKLTVGRA